MTASKSGTIVKVLANEEDTVAVGQDLFVLEPGEVGACTSYSYPSLCEPGALIQNKKLPPRRKKSRPLLRLKFPPPEQKLAHQNLKHHHLHLHRQKQKLCPNPKKIRLLHPKNSSPKRKIRVPLLLPGLHQGAEARPEYVFFSCSILPIVNISFHFEGKNEPHAFTYS